MAIVNDSIIILYNPDGMEAFCPIQATRQFDEVYGSLLKEKRWEVVLSQHS